jgi:hypothetical protein
MEAPELTDDDRQWIIGAFSVLNRLSKGSLEDIDLPSAAWFMAEKTRLPSFRGGAVSDVTAGAIRAAAETAEEQAAATRYFALQPGRRLELLEAVILVRKRAGQESWVI